MAAAAPSVQETRYRQMFPVLGRDQIAVARRFAAPLRVCAPGEVLYRLGDLHPPAFVVLSGSLEIQRLDALGHDLGVTQHGPGEFSGEVGQISGRPALAQVRAGTEGAEVAAIDAEGLRRLVVASADVGEILMRAFILRRVALMESGAGGPVLIGPENAIDTIRLRTFLTRNSQPYTLLDPAVDAEAAALLAKAGPSVGVAPLVLLPDGATLHNPSEQELARRLGMAPDLSDDRLYDVLIVGAGPAGLAAAVYATSEGLSALVLDRRAIGGQAGASARIENYLGFPTGITGQALAGRAFSQAQKFGAVVAVGVEAARLDCGDPPKDGEGVWSLQIDAGRAVRGRAVIVASGAAYRRPGIPELSASEGRGIHYWASALEAKMCAGETLALVGGGNSAGQAAVYLAGHAAKVCIIVRRPLEQTMSRYLIDRIAAMPNIELHTGAEVSGLIQDADGTLAGIRWRSKDGAEKTQALRHLFLFIGADPNTEWLAGCGFALDEKGFMLCGADLEASDLARYGWGAKRPASLETNRPGVFAIGDVRSGSTKRVASAVGEGAAVVAQIHAYLA